MNGLLRDTGKLTVTSSEKEMEVEEAVCDLQQSFVVRKKFIRPQPAVITPQDAEPQEPSEYFSTERLCLSRTNLEHITDSILKYGKLKCLYLERNRITIVPETVFTSLPNLLWLDLRHNQIETLPPSVGLHRCLEVLLLEGNPISELPAELGIVGTLRGLHLRDCPITFPPQDIIQQGLQVILQYLRTALAESPPSLMKTSPELPAVEKLQLSVLMESSVQEQDDSMDEEELQNFRELKHKMILLDKAELGSTAQRARKKKHPPVNKTRQESLQRRPSQTKQDKPKKKSKQRNQQEAKTHLNPGVQNSGGSPAIQTMCVAESEESRSARRLEGQIRAHVETIKEHGRKPRGLSSEQKAAAEQDVEEMRKLQSRLMDTKTNRGRNLGKPFTIFTADTESLFH